MGFKFLGIFMAELQHKISIGERIFHAVLFEILAILLTIVGLIFFTEHQLMAVSGLVILISLIAMVWNFIFNWIFDYFFPASRETRGLKIRLLHVTLFEGGLLCITLPLVAYLLNVSLWQAFVIDFAMTVFIVIYTLIFNYTYDHARASIVKRKYNKI